MITHLKSNYYKINLAAQKENTALMTSAYDINQIFKIVINQIKMAVNFTNAGRVSFTPNQVATTAYNMIFSDGHFTDSCQCWKSKPSSNKTWENFKSFFSDDHQIWQETQSSSAGGIYLLANSIDHNKEDTVNAITLLAAASESDRETYSNLATTIASLTAEL